ncbi:ATP synthase E chain-domain-containing protein [Podospora didyma]|uniref:ATP synthase F(0) complex subunit e, mitochondrial n=1 Tax=Podospora didyma TaxID=330526 RepID=A0AAE0P735_9PEZI|nr:ATP synthase E chain-domain-containing protein [Podospora didyma]
MTEGSNFSHKNHALGVHTKVIPTYRQRHEGNKDNPTHKTNFWRDALLLQVLRYTVLGLGIFYGFSHQRAINAANKAAHQKHEYEHKQQLINKAKAEYAKTKGPAAPAATATQTSGGLNQDLSDPKFDLESYINAFLEAKA